MSASSFFTDVFDSVEKTLEFNKNWSNGTGYFDYAVYSEHAPKLQSGEMAKSKTPAGRRLIFVGTLLGNIVVFDRYDPKNTLVDKNLFVHNTTKAIDQGKWIPDTYLTEDQLAIIFGEIGIKNEEGKPCNLGWRIEQVYQGCKKAKQQQ